MMSGLATYLFDPVAKRLGHDWVYGVLALLPQIALAVLPLSIQVGMNMMLLCVLFANVTVSMSMGRSLESDFEIENFRYFSALVQWGRGHSTGIRWLVARGKDK